MTKGEETREMILQRAAEVFNRKGYFGASMGDIMAATGLEKGGIYNYFESKDDLALQAFDYAVDLVREQFAVAIKGKRNAIDRLHAVFEVFHAMTVGTPVPGGCPILNTAVEADDAHPALRARAREAMWELHDSIRRIIQRGIERGEIRSDVDADQTASVFYSTLEGAVILTRLSEDPTRIAHVIAHLSQFAESNLRAP